MKENNATICENIGWNQVSDENLSFYRAIGVDGVSILGLPVIDKDKSPAEELNRKKELIESYGMKVYDVRWSVPDWRIVTNGLDGRDRQIEMCCNAIRAIGSANVPLSGYTFMSIGHFRTSPTNGRGGAKYSTFNLEEFRKEHPVEYTRGITKEQLWENMEYFLRPVIPVAEESNVRLALHPDDPPLDIPLDGAPRIITSPESYKRVFDIVPSDSNAMLFCQGCFSEMGVDVLENIRYFASQKKICMVHFRSLRGNPHKFEEVFIDEGELDMLTAIQAYKDSGFQGPFLLDHVPSIPQSTAARAYAIGYIRAMIQVVYR